MGRLDVLFERPIAHRGLHDRSFGVVENTPRAVARAIEHDFAIEVDVQLSADGQAVVFHDKTLDRLTEGSGPVSALTLAELRGVAFRETSDRFWTLDECVDLVAGRQALVVEVKSQGRDMRLARVVAKRLSGRGEPVAAKSFDPRVVWELRRRAPSLPRGIIGESFSEADGQRPTLSSAQRYAARNLLHWPWTLPDFLSWHVADLPRRSVSLMRAAGTPVMTWTVRTPEEQARAGLHADQMVFEGFMP